MYSDQPFPSGGPSASACACGCGAPVPPRLGATKGGHPKKFATLDCGRRASKRSPAGREAKRRHNAKAAARRLADPAFVAKREEQARARAESVRNTAARYKAALDAAGGSTYRARKILSPEWVEKERERLRQKRRRRTALAPAEADTITPADMHILQEAFGWRTCAYCRTPVGQRGVTWDHVVPMRAGAGLTPHNSVPCCRSCNSSKSDGEVAAWMASKGFDYAAFAATWAAALEKIGPEVGRPVYDWRALNDARARRFAGTAKNRLGPAGYVQGPPRPCRYLCGNGVHARGLCAEHYARDEIARRQLDRGITPLWIRVNSNVEATAAGATLPMSRQSRRLYRRRAGLSTTRRTAANFDPSRPVCTECARGNINGAGRCMVCYARQRSTAIRAGTWRPRR